MKYLLFILICLSSAYPFGDSILIKITYTDIEFANPNVMKTASIPEPESKNYEVDNENIQNPDLEYRESIGFKLLPISVNSDGDSIRKMEYYSFYGDNNNYYINRWRTWDQFKHLDSSFIIKEDGILKIIIWPRVAIAPEWCTSIKLEGDSSQSWDDVITVDSEFKMTAAIYDGSIPGTTAYRAVGVGRVHHIWGLYDRQAYDDSVTHFIDSLAVVDSIRIADSLAIIDSIRIADSLSTNVTQRKPTISTRELRPYNVLGRRIYNKCGWIRRLYK